MNIIYYELPAPHIIIDDFYSDKELGDIWKELDFLTNSRALYPGNKTMSATNAAGNMLKKNGGTFLNYIFESQPSISHILTYNKKLFSHELLKEAINKHFIFRYMATPNTNSTLLSYYRDGDYYDSHHDNAVISICTWLYKEPKQFTGGDFILSEYDHKIHIKNNRTVIFPSVLKHAVEIVKMNDKDDLPFSGNGRYTIGHFIKS
jgi:Rps23 Pro-64 3,4-dihydroxylase Tpa1-like proline 4-hydroxylase